MGPGGGNGCCPTWGFRVGNRIDRRAKVRMRWLRFEAHGLAVSRGVGVCFWLRIWVTGQTGKVPRGIGSNPKAKSRQSKLGGKIQVFPTVAPQAL